MLVLKNITLNFPVLVTPRSSVDGDKLKYSVCVMIPKEDTTSLDAINKAIEECYEENKATLGKNTKAVRTPLRDGEEREIDYPEFAGHMFFNCSSMRKPKVLDMEKNLLSDEEVLEHAFAGQVVNISLNVFAYTHASSKGISIGLNNVQIVGGGTPLYEDKGGSEFN